MGRLDSCYRLVVGDVVGFRHNQPAVFASFLGKLRQKFATVEMAVCNARDAMVAQNRNRLFFVCTNSISLAPMQRAVVRQRTCSAPTHPTMRKMLRPYVPAKQLAKMRGVFIPQLKMATRGADGRPRRIMSIDRHAPTITSVFGVRGGVSKRCFDRYRVCDADVCAKDACLWLEPRLWGVLLGFEY